jgi:hypothetical protein
MPTWTDFLLYMTGSLCVSACVHGLLRAWLRPLCAALPTRVERRLWLGLATLFPLGMLGLLFMNTLPRGLAATIAWPCFGWVGVCYFLLLCAPLSWGLGPVLARRGLTWDAAQRRSRRLCCGLALGLGIYASWQALRPPDVVRRRVELPSWPASARGYRIAHISDLHVGATIGRARVQMVVDAINRAEVDLVAITGDLVDGSVSALGPELAPLMQLRSRDGVFFALGNHEYFSPTEDWVRFLPRLGVVVLRNRLHPLPAFDLVGLDEWSAPEFTSQHRPDVQAALRGRRSQLPAVVLVHQPQAARVLRSLNREAHSLGLGSAVDLQLSGHTHGGQVFPLGQLARWDQGQLDGVTQSDGLTVHVTPGAGHWGPAMRLLSRAEVSILELYPREE